MDDPTLPLPGLSPLGRTSIAARFDGGSLSSAAGVLGQFQMKLEVGALTSASFGEKSAERLP